MKARHLGISALIVSLLIGVVIGQPIAPKVGADEFKISINSIGFDAQTDHILDIGTFAVDSTNREESRVFFNAIYWASEYATIDWTGDYDPLFSNPGNEADVLGQVGDISELFKEAVLTRINYYRAMSGVPAGVVLDDSLNEIAQYTAMIMGGNDSISHFPVDVGFNNYITPSGTQGAADSNLAIGSYGPDSIDGYMEDKGLGNISVGHRRWLLYPPMLKMGTGDVPSLSAPDIPQAALDNIDARRGGTTTTVRRANAIHVFDPGNQAGVNYNAANFPTVFPYVAFPPPGFVPYQTIPARWSFAIKGADLSSATVTMTRDGGSIPVALETYLTGFGDNTLVWVYDGLDASQSHLHPKPNADVTYEVTIDGIAGADETSYTYQVVVFDPETPTQGESTQTMVTGPAEPATGSPNSYNVALPAFAALESNANVTGIRFRSFMTSNGDFIEGAESGIGSLVPRIFGDYDPINTDSNFASSGTQSFHLATGELGTNQTITFPNLFLIGDTSELSFQSMVRLATDSQFARVNISLDNGVSWINVFSQAGLTPQGQGGAPDENAFSEKTIDLSPYSGRTINIQFGYEHVSGFAFNGTDTNNGWIFDDITLSGIESLSGTSTSTFLADATSFDFTPAATGEHGLQAQGMLFGIYELEWGPTLKVNAVNAVNAVDDNESINEGAPNVSGSVLGNDTAPIGETLSVDQVNGNGGDVGQRIATTYGHVTIEGDGDFTYELDNTNSDVTDLDDGESLEDSVTYRATDTMNNQDTATLRITINGKSVSVSDDEDAIDEGDDYVTGSVTENDGAADGETLSVDEVNGNPDNLNKRIPTDYGYIVIAEDGSYAYQIDNSNSDVANLNDGETLTDTISYQATDSQDRTDAGALRITITGKTNAGSSGSSRIVNIATRSEILTGDSVMIAGFVIQGSDSMDVVIRGVGPTLGDAPHNVPNSISDPQIELFRTDFTQNPPVTSSWDSPDNPNAAWGGSTELADAMTLVGAFPLPTDSQDAAIRTTLGEGLYTVVMRGVSDVSGIGLVEVYDETSKTDPNADTRLVNIATRGVVGSAEDTIMIAGLVVVGDKPHRVLVRAKGPGLDVGGADTLDDPKIKILAINPVDGQVVSETLNEDWGDGVSNDSAEVLLVADSVGSRDYEIGSVNAGIVVELQPNFIYSVNVTGNPGDSGNALVEVFDASNL